MKRNLVEWAVLLASIVGIVAVVAVLVVDGLQASRPADPSVELRPSEGRTGALGWLVPARVTNAGDEAAQEVVIEAQATVAGELETSEVVIDYLAAGTQLEIAFGFSAQPESAVVARLVSFQTP